MVDSTCARRELCLVITVALKCRLFSNLHILRKNPWCSFFLSDTMDVKQKANWSHWLGRMITGRVRLLLNVLYPSCISNILINILWQENKFGVASVWNCVLFLLSDRLSISAEMLSFFIQCAFSRMYLNRWILCVHYSKSDNLFPEQ